MNYALRIVLSTLLLAFFGLAAAPQAHASGGEEGKEFEVKDMLFHHILDSHDWHIADIPVGTKPDGTTEYLVISIPLPYILYTSQNGLQVFMSSGHPHEGEVDALTAHGFKADEHGHITLIDGSPNAKVIDLSITKTVAQMMLVAVLLILVFSSVAGAYKRRAGQAPKGMQSLFEPIIVFVRDEIAKPNLHGKHDRYVPYLLTLFFFIWFSNLLGLTPLNSNIAGNISITAALATLTLIITNLSGSKDYWAHIFWTPGVPTPIRIGIMLPVELIGIFTKPFSLTIRLFANIAGGHFMVLSLIGLIFLLSKNGTSPTGAFSIMPLSVAFTLGIMVLEFLVALIQAYVFTLLTAVFIGQALESHSHHDHAHDHGAPHTDHAHAH